MDAPAGTDLEFDDSFGIAARVRADVKLDDKRCLNFDLRWINIETDATLDGAFATEVEIDPWVAGATVGLRF